MTDTPIPELEARLVAATAAPIDPVRRVDALTELAWAVRNDDVPRAYALASEGRDLAIEHGYKLGQARAARTMAMTFRDADDLTTVVQLADESKRLFDDCGDAVGRAGSRDLLSSIYEHIGELTVALDFGLDALSIARAVGDPLRQGYALANVGGILAASGEVDAGIERLEEGLRIMESVGDLDAVAALCTRLCKVHKAAGRPEEALRYAERCRDLAESNQNEWLYASAVSVMAEVEAERGDPVSAERLYRSAIGALTDNTSKKLLGAAIQVDLGRMLIEHGSPTEAAEELNDALARIAGDRVTIVTERAAHEALAELCERQGDLAAANAHLRKAQAVRDQIAQRDARSKLAQVEARAAMEAAKKDAEIYKLRFVELHEAQSRLIEAEKLALLGRLAAGAAHELNTPLGALSTNAQLAAAATERLLALVPPDGEGAAQAAKLAAALASCKQSTDRAVQRISGVAQSLGRFAQLDQAELRAFDVRDGLESALSLLEPTLPEGIRLERKLDSVPTIDAWARELNQAFMTVLENAAQAIERSGVITVETSATATHVLLRVRDDGRGMTEEKAAHLFDMAWSEEGARTKMRMGLCAAHATTLRHGGEIHVQSSLGQGTTITFKLPIARQR